jgi:hypothetical protein
LPPKIRPTNRSLHPKTNRSLHRTTSSSFHPTSPSLRRAVRPRSWMFRLKVRPTSQSSFPRRAPARSAPQKRPSCPGISRSPARIRRASEPPATPRVETASNSWYLASARGV